MNLPENQPGKSAKFFKNIFYILFLLIFLWVCGKLFFEEELNSLFERDVETTQAARITDLRVIYPEEPASLEPTLMTPAARQRLVNLYEPLVRPDADLNMRPALALSWGLIDDYTWEFEFRPDVRFHDGSTFDAQDVVASIEAVGSELTSSIQNIEIIDDFTLRIHTIEPDPLLLPKLSFILIASSEDASVGTGPYKLLSWEDETMIFERFEEYWGDEAQFDTVEMYSVADKSDRVNMFLQGEGDLITFVSYDALPYVEERGFATVYTPTLEVQFLLFNVNSGFLQDLDARQAVSYAIDQEALVEVVGGYAKPISQFVGNGIFGFNPNISGHQSDIELASELARHSGLSGKTLQLHLPIGLDILGEHVRESLNEAGILVIVSYLEPDRLLASMEQQQADMYFLAFKSELGDAADFLSSEFNIFEYENENFEYLVETSLTEFDQHRRRDALQEAMRLIVEEDVIGVPLFEYETVMSHVNGLVLEPRIDGMIYFDELILN